MTSDVDASGHFVVEVDQRLLGLQALVVRRVGHGAHAHGVLESLLPHVALGRSRSHARGPGKGTKDLHAVNGTNLYQTLKQYLLVVRDDHSSA